MSTTLTISDELAAALEAKRSESGLSSIDAAAEVILADAILASDGDAGDFGLSQESLRVFVAEGEASGPLVEWDAAAAREEIRRRFAARQSK
jgi:hypothetical protein